ncbi:DUF5134 domain-containing protein [Enemella evansiae]|uniref:DUF5134 domain-containing protein n=1 Tax=Enemella evansiae TaxID=2016499 RepID=UPI0011810D7D|nr:DUF5134 domain-containing protein [Enemella evansiae]
MLPAPWSIVLTLLFCGTAAYALLQLVRLASRPRAEGPGGQVVELNHLVMSVLMVAMVWWMPGGLGTAVQVAALGLFGLALLRYATRPELARGTRIAMAAHLIGNVAMIWMLVAMPWLMGHGTATSDPAAAGQHAGHGGGAEPAPGGAMPPMEMPMGTPGWMTVVTLVLAGLLVLTAIGWLVHRHRARELRAGDDWSHRICHAAMTGGMAAMLVVMR